MIIDRCIMMRDADVFTSGIIIADDICLQRVKKRCKNMMGLESVSQGLSISLTNFTMEALLLV